MSGEYLGVEELSRGDIICPVGTKVKFIVSKIENGYIYTREKRTDKKGPLLSQEGLREYYKYNIRENDSDEYRKKIISTYLERHKGTAAKKEAQSRYMKKQGELAKEMNRITEVLAEPAERAGMTVEEYILMVAEYYEKSKGH